MPPPWELAIDETDALDAGLVALLAEWAADRLDENPDNPFDKIPVWDDTVNGPRVGGKEFLENLMNPPRIGEGDANWEKREAAILEQITKGNIPDFMREPQYVHVTFKGGDGEMHVASYRVMPDYLAIGTNDDYVLVPMTGNTAQKICDQMGFVLPTAQMVDQIYGTAQRNGTALVGDNREYYQGGGHIPRLPDTSDPDMAHLQQFRTDNGFDAYTNDQKAELQTSTWAYAEHDLAIKENLPAPHTAYVTHGALFAGHKKDIVSGVHPIQTYYVDKDTGKRVTDPNYPKDKLKAVTDDTKDNLAIYGFHTASGDPMQGKNGMPSYTHHTQNYADYSHGARMVDQYMVIDGEMKKVSEVLADPNLAKGLSGEGVIKDVRVPGVPTP